MARDILGEYGPDKSSPQAARATSGGVEHAKPLPYSPPVGPTNLHHQGPGLGGGNHGMAARPVPDADDCRGSPGLAGATVHKSGSQRG
jgi:hypothetical protein